MEYIVKNIRAHTKHCMGCQKTNSDVMITFQTDRFAHQHMEDLSAAKEPHDITFHDLFLTQEQAEAFYDELGKALKHNKET